jgi:hypothetical protein
MNIRASAELLEILLLCLPGKEGQHWEFTQPSVVSATWNFIEIFGKMINSEYFFMISISGAKCDIQMTHPSLHHLGIDSPLLAG